MGRQRIVVVTGGGSGMGRAIAHRFADSGDVTYILGRRREKLEQTAKGKSNIQCVVCDVTDVASIEAAKKIILSAHKNIDVLVNNAGGNIKVDPDTSLVKARAAWEQITAMNLTSIFSMIFAFQTHIAKDGRVINISSIAAIGGSRQGGVAGQAYAAAKSGIHGLSRTLVGSLGERQITINCVAPGVIDNTEFFAGKSVPDELKEIYRPKIPLGRFGFPDDVAAGVFFLASKEAGYITGEMLNINGGVQFGR